MFLVGDLVLLGLVLCCWGYSCRWEGAVFCRWLLEGLLILSMGRSFGAARGLLLLGVGILLVVAHCCWEDIHLVTNSDLRISS